MKIFFSGMCIILTCLTKLQAQTEDAYQWLEDVHSEKSMAFVNEHNAATFETLSKHKAYQPIYDKSLSIYNSTERIVYPTLLGDYVYNFWQDKEHVRGIWRRATKASYLSGKPEWDILLDIDALSAKDNIKWVYKGATGLYPKYNRFLVSLSNGGGDAVFVKEFDVTTKSFIADGFTIDEAKGGAGYLDENTLVVSTDFGEGTMTTSGYPSQVKLWKRGTAITDAQLIYNGELEDVGTWGSVMRDGDKAYTVISQAKTFYTSKTLVWYNNKPVVLDIPEDCSLNALQNDQVIISLKSDWTVNGVVYKQGDVISMHFPKLLKGEKQAQLIIHLFKPMQWHICWAGTFPAAVRPQPVFWPFSDDLLQNPGMCLSDFPLRHGL